MNDLVIYPRNLNKTIRIVRKSEFLYLINTIAKKNDFNNILRKLFIYLFVPFLK